MFDPSTTQLQVWIERMNAGDATARQQLVGHTCERLRRLTRKMLHDFPRVGRREDADDVLHNAVLRLLRALESVPLSSVAEFFRLAAMQIRRELIDLARHYARCPEALVQPTRKLEEDSSGGTPPTEKVPSASTCDPQKLASWSEFHKQVEALPVQEREVFGLLWYHGMSQAEAAGVLNVSLATVKRWWMSARLRLQAARRGKRQSAQRDGLGERNDVV
jgi:RNA polymerase sigma-70 factor (ECF subfamily)